METLLEYYLPGLDASTLNDQQFITKLAYLLKIREQEKTSELANVLGILQR